MGPPNSSSQPAATSVTQSDTRVLRRIACVRCRRRKKRCDRAVPVCSECDRTGSECVQVGARTCGPMATVPTAYLRQLESQITALQQTSRDSCAAVDDAPVQHEHSSYPSPFENGCEDVANWPGSNDKTSDAHQDDYEMSTIIPTSTNNLSARSPSMDPNPRLSTGNTHSPPQSLHDLRTMTPQHCSGTSPASHSAVSESQIPHDLNSIGEDWRDHYAYTYFHHAQPQWSFLDEETWRVCYRDWTTGSRRLEEAHLFILQMVLATGALLSSSYRQDCPHLTHASRLYETAIQRHIGSIMQNPSPLTRTQASLLMLIYSWHDPTHNVATSYIMLVLMNCESLIDKILEDDNAGVGNSTNRLLQRRCVMTCHIVNEIISSAWSYPQSFLFEALDNKIFQYTSTMKFELNGSGFYERLFQLRVIQSRIRHTDTKLRRLDPTDPFRGSCQVRLKDELQAWKDSVQAFTSSTPPDHIVYHEPQSLLKLYDYGLSILVQGDLSIMCVEDVAQLIECCSEACRTFRTSQETNPLMYWTWTALMYQFRLGIMLLYCYFTTPRTIQTPVFSLETTLDGIESCRQTLTGFSSRWPKSMVYLRTFQSLAGKTFEGSYAETVADSTPFESSAALTHCLASESSRDWITSMETLITELKLQHVHQAVVKLIQDMVHRASSENFNIESMEFVPNLALGSLDLFNFCVPT